MTSARDDKQSPTDDASSRNGKKQGVKTARPENKGMGVALRSVYQRTVEEAVPDDLIALLGKLD